MVYILYKRRRVSDESEIGKGLTSRVTVRGNDETDYTKNFFHILSLRYAACVMQAVYLLWN